LLISLLKQLSLHIKVISFFCFCICFFSVLEDEFENTSKWKESLLARTQSRRSANLMQLVYGLPSTKLGGVALEENDDSEANSSDDEFFIPKGQKVHIRCMHGSCVQYKLYFFV
jgi:hypothetical protein